MTDKTNTLLLERAQTYGDPVTCHSRIAEVWSGILGRTVTAHQVALCMAGLKLVRADITPEHADSLDDAAGYVRIGQLIMGYDEPRVEIGYTIDTAVGPMRTLGCEDAPPEARCFLIPGIHDESCPSYRGPAGGSRLVDEPLVDWRDRPHTHAGTDCGGGEDCPGRALQESFR